jgi:copper chaperone CopZ
MISILVNGMTCGHCANAVTQAVQSIDNNAKVAVSLADKRVDIESAATLAQLRDAIEAAGYEVTAAAN